MIDVLMCMHHVTKCVWGLFSVPTAPRNFKLVVESSKSISASWLEPLKLNGLFQRYVVMYGTASSKLDERVNTTSTAYLITGLEEFTEYFVQVHAETSVSGAPSSIEQAKTHEDGKLFALEGYSRIHVKRTAAPTGNLLKP